MPINKRNATPSWHSNRLTCGQAKRKNRKSLSCFFVCFLCCFFFGVEVILVKKLFFFQLSTFLFFLPQTPTDSPQCSSSPSNVSSTEVSCLFLCKLSLVLAAPYWSSWTSSSSGDSSNLTSWEAQMVNKDHRWRPWGGTLPCWWRGNRLVLLKVRPRSYQCLKAALKMAMQIEWMWRRMGQMDTWHHVPHREGRSLTVTEFPVIWRRSRNETEHPSRGGASLI